MTPKTLTRPEKTEQSARSPEEIRESLAAALARRTESSRGDKFKARDVLLDCLDIVTGEAAESRLPELSDNELDGLEEALKTLGKNMSYFQEAVEIRIQHRANAEYRDEKAAATVERIGDEVNALARQLDEARRAVPVLTGQHLEAQARLHAFSMSRGRASRLVSRNPLLFATGEEAFRGDDVGLKTEDTEGPRVGLSI